MQQKTVLQRNMHRDQIGRDGRVEKRIVDDPPVPGMKRQTKGQMAAYHHGQTVDDEPNTTKSFESKIPLHPSTPARIAAKVHPVLNNAGVILREAGRLGRKA